MLIDILMEVIWKVAINPTICANLLTSIRALTNLFKNSQYYNWLQKHCCLFLFSPFSLWIFGLGNCTCVGQQLENYTKFIRHCTLFFFLSHFSQWIMLLILFLMYTISLLL